MRPASAVNPLQMLTGVCGTHKKSWDFEGERAVGQRRSALQI